MPTRSRNSPKLQCPECGSYRSEVLPINQRHVGPVHEGGFDAYRRIRCCADCGMEYTTLERVEGAFIRQRPRRKYSQDVR